MGTIRSPGRYWTGCVERGRGRIVSLGSDAGRVGSSGEVVYSATKGGVIAFCKALAREVPATNITVNCVCPGPTNTALLDQVAEASQRLYDGLPGRSHATHRPPDRYRPGRRFPGRRVAGYVTGQTLSVSGGLTMS